MPERPRKAPFANPFYALLLVASTAFVFTALGYTISLFVIDQALKQAQGGPGPASRAVANWLDRHGPAALAGEFLIMFGSAILAMATDRHFSPKPTRKEPKPQG
jgi:hypothetical protein